MELVASPQIRKTPNSTTGINCSPPTSVEKNDYHEALQSHQVIQICPKSGTFFDVSIAASDPPRWLLTVREGSETVTPLLLAR